MINFYKKKNTKAILLAVALHVILILFLFKSFISHQYTEDPNSEKIIEASLLTPIDNVMKLQEQAEQESQELVMQEQQVSAPEEEKAPPVPQPQVAEVKPVPKEVAPIAEAKNIEKQEQEKRLIAQAVEKQKKEKVLAEQQKKTAEKIAKHAMLVAQAKQAKEKKLKELAQQKKSLAEKQKKLHALLAQDFEREIAEEGKRLTAAPTLKINPGEMDKYKAKIIHAISQHWIIPEMANKNLNCKLLIRLASQGKVVDVKLVSTSGDIALDRSAMAAVYKASPLPLPTDPQLSDQFREFQLTVRPEFS
jgi:colicin import membrane protein